MNLHSLRASRVTGRACTVSLALLVSCKLLFSACRGRRITGSFTRSCRRDLCLSNFGRQAEQAGAAGGVGSKVWPGCVAPIRQCIPLRDDGPLCSIALSSGDGISTRHGYSSLSLAGFSPRTRQQDIQQSGCTSESSHDAG